MVLKNFSTKVTHLNKHGTPTEGLFKCLFRSCTKTCIKSELKKHMEQHSRETKDLSFECEHCVRSFANRQGLVIHLNKHFTKTPGQWKCVFAACKSLFFNSSDLKHHAQIHLKTPQLLCSECDKFFPTDFVVKQHKKIHIVPEKTTVDVDFVCKLCGSNFVIANYHMKKHETETRGVFQCITKKCQRRFASVSEFKLHLATHKDEKSQCETCGKLVGINELRQHMRLHLITHSLATFWDVPLLAKIKQTSTFTRQMFTTWFAIFEEGLINIVKLR
jgi:hypothetical protein